MKKLLMRSNLRVRRPQTSMKEQDCHRVQVLGLLSFPVISIGTDRVISTTSNTVNALLFSASVLVIGTSKQELLLAAISGGRAFNALFHILFYVQLYINVNSLQRVTRIHNHYSQNDKIVKLGLPRP